MNWLLRLWHGLCWLHKLTEHHRTCGRIQEVRREKWKIVFFKQLLRNNLKVHKPFRTWQRLINSFTVVMLLVDTINCGHIYIEIHCHKLECKILFTICKCSGAGTFFRISFASNFQLKTFNGRPTHLFKQEILNFLRTCAKQSAIIIQR